MPGGYGYAGWYLYEIPETIHTRRKVSEKDLNDAVRRILDMKFRLGLFEDPYRYMDKTREKEEVLSEEHLEVARMPRGNPWYC